MTDQAVAWLRQAILARKFLAEHTVELGNAAEWTELSSGVLMTCRPDAPQDGWDGVWPMGDSTLTRLMEANDPRDTIARCEAELAILDYCLPGEAMAKMLGAGIISAEEYATHEAVGLHVVRTVASAYRHHEGYAQYWGSE